jgi:hypothetical protein
MNNNEIGVVIPNVNSNCDFTFIFFTFVILPPFENRDSLCLDFTLIVELINQNKWNENLIKTIGKDTEYTT